MALFHSYTLPQQKLSILSPFSSKPLSVSLPHSSSYRLTTTTDFNNNRTLSLSTLPRKLLSKPLNGKHVREDYLVKKLSAQEIQELVKGDRNVPLIIDFYATWCGPCILMAQELEMLAVEYEQNAMIVKVDTDDEYEFARDMQWRKKAIYHGLGCVASSNPRIHAVRGIGGHWIEFGWPRFQVRGLPTLFFISPDPKKDAIRTEGLIPIQMMRDIIDKEM